MAKCSDRTCAPPASSFLIRELHPGWSPSAVAAAIRRAATPESCPTDWPADDERQCTGGGGKTSFYGAGMANALAAVAR